MQASDRSEFTKLIGDVMAYNRQDCSEFLMQVWWQAMQPFELSQVRKAMSLHAADPDRGQFAPKVADIVRALGGTSTDRAQLAWGKTFEAMARVGAYTDVVFDDAVIHAVIEDLGGWPKVCRIETDELSYLQHRFMQGYRSYAARGSELRYPRALRGDRSPDEEFTRLKMLPPKPALIGDVEQARRVYAQGGEAKARVTFGHINSTAIDRVPQKLLRAA
jgi:Domain of unknown function (DUF6475)